MPKVIELVTKPTVADEIKDGIVRALEKALEEAKAGQMDHLVMVMSYAGGEWKDYVSGTEECSRMIGRLEIVKYSWMRQYLNAEREECPHG